MDNLGPPSTIKQILITKIKNAIGKDMLYNHGIALGKGQNAVTLFSNKFLIKNTLASIDQEKTLVFVNSQQNHRVSRSTQNSFLRMETWWKLSSTLNFAPNMFWLTKSDTTETKPSLTSTPFPPITQSYLLSISLNVAQLLLAKCAFFPFLLICNILILYAGPFGRRLSLWFYYFLLLFSFISITWFEICGK